MFIQSSLSCFLASWEKKIKEKQNIELSGISSFCLWLTYGINPFFKWVFEVQSVKLGWE